MHVPFRFALIGLAALPSSTPARLAAQEPERNELAIFQACAAITDDRERHRCLDEALRMTGMINAEQVEANRRENFGRNAAAQTQESRAATASSAKSPAAPSPAPEDHPEATPAKQARPKHSASSDPRRQPLQTTIASARLIGAHTLEISTADAGVWASIERENFRKPPRNRAEMEIIPGALGGFRCRLERTTLFACRRLD